MGERLESSAQENSLRELLLAEDPTLVARVAQGEEGAIRCLYDRYSGVIYALARKALGSSEESEEVVLDTFLQVWRTASRYQARQARVDQWLFMIARSRILDRLRRFQRASKVQASCQGAIQSSSRDGDPLEEACLRERRLRVLAALNQLPPEQRQAIELAYYQGLTRQEVAEYTGWALGTVKTRIRLGLNQLRVALGPGDQT